MNILFIYDNKNIEFNELVNNLEKETSELLYDITIKYSKKNSINQKNKADIYIILSNDLNETNDYLKNIKEQNKTFVITNNLDSEYIISVCSKCPNICYSKVEVEDIVKRIYRVYINAKD